MEWKEWNGKKVFLKLKDGSVYSGKVIDIDDSSAGLIFLTIIDKYNEKVTIIHSEIIKIKEENNG